MVLNVGKENQVIVQKVRASADQALVVAIAARALVHHALYLTVNRAQVETENSVAKDKVNVVLSVATDVKASVANVQVVMANVNQVLVAEIVAKALVTAHAQQQTANAVQVEMESNAVKDALLMVIDAKVLALHDLAATASVVLLLV